MQVGIEACASSHYWSRELQALKNNVMVGLAAAAFVSIFFFAVPFPIIIFGAVLIGFLGTWSGARAFQVERLRPVTPEQAVAVPKRGLANRCLYYSGTVSWNLV